MARLFQTEYLLGLLRGPGQTCLRGTLTRADCTLLPGIAVAAVGTAETARDAAGRYALSVPAGNYMVRFSGADYVPQELPVSGREEAAGWGAGESIRKLTFK